MLALGYLLLYYKIYIVYIDLITTLIIGVPSHQFPHLMELLLVRYSNPCLRLFVVVYYKIYIVYRDFIITLIIVVLNYTIIKKFTFSRPFISQI